MSVMCLLYRLNVGSITDVSDVRAASNLRVVDSRIYVFGPKGLGRLLSLFGSVEPKTYACTNTYATDSF
jgi:hypothetical protein